VPKKLKTVVVTGSMIQTAEATPIAPVITITADDIAKQGAATLSEVIKRLPQNRGSLDDKFQNGFAPGSSEVSLRGLGAKYTLVLLNGHRVAPYGYGQGISDAFTDLNSLPAAAIDRIEVLPEGASATYGSDAIAGVVNIILKKDYTGTELTSRIGNTFKSDMLEQSYSITSGFQNKKKDTSVLVSVDYYHRDALSMSERAITASADHTDRGGSSFLSELGPNPGYFYGVNGETVGVYPDLSTFDLPANITSTGAVGGGATNNAYDYNRDLNIMPEARRYGVMIVAEHKFSDTFDVDLETDYRNSWTREVAAPTPITGDQPPNLYGYPLGQSFIVSANNPYNIFSNDLSFRYRLLEAGPRIDEVTTEAFRLVPSINFHLANEWEAKASFIFNPLTTKSKGYNYLNADAVQAALNSTNPATALNIFAPATNYAPGLANNPALIQSLKTNPRRTGESGLAMGEASANGPLFQLPGGKLRMAVGTDYRHESFSDSSDPLSTAERVVSQGISSGAGHRDVAAGFGELIIPVFGEDNEKFGLRALEFDVAARFDSYTDFGNTVNPKYAFKYSPHKDFVIRGSYGTGFRAPSLRELYLGTSTSYQQLLDSATNAPSYNQNNYVEYRVITGGNPTLKAETSENWNLGVVYEPSFVPGLKLEASWSKISFVNAIAQSDPQQLIDYPDIFPGAVVRNPVTHEIQSITNTWANFGSTEVQVIDIDAKYVLPTSWGEFTFSTAFSREYSYKLDGQEFAGSYNTPVWSGNGSIFWNYRHLTMGVTVNWNDSFYQTQKFDSSGNPRPLKTIEDWITTDLQVSYEFPHDFSCTFGVRNVMDENPPFSDSETEGYNGAYHDAVGRNWYLEVTKKF
jgi:outer membrane receptor for ferrienterochelin and colicin